MKNFHLKVNDVIELKTPVNENAEAVFQLVNENRERLSQYMEWESKTNTKEDILSYFERNKHLSYYDKDYPLIIFYKEEIVGIAGYNNGDILKKTVDIGYWIGEKYSGNGIVTKCTQALVNFAFSLTDIQTIIIKCEISNIKSYAIPRKLGFEFVSELEGGCFIKNGKPTMLTYQLKK